MQCRKGFTLIELLTVIVIIGILSMMVFGAMHTAREAGREAATKATIAKLHAIIMERYESYLRRRVPLNTSALTLNDAAKARLYAIRDIMRMEMPDRLEDITSGPIAPAGLAGPVPRPVLSQLYWNYYSSHPVVAYYATSGCTSAEMLYLTVSLGSPEAMEQFRRSEIGDTDGNGYLEFLDGWGQPIFFLRWAPGFSAYSGIQRADPVNHHDPFDARHIDQNAFHLIPLIYSYGRDGVPGLDRQVGLDFSATGGDIFNGTTNYRNVGSPSNDYGRGTMTDFQDNITNHSLDIR